MITDSQYDTKPLASMNDTDLRPNCKIPVSNPMFITDTTYATCKLALSVMVRKIISSVFGITPPSYDTIMKFDAEVRDLYDSFPTEMKHSPGNHEGEITLRVKRIAIKAIMCHTLVILHRPFLQRSTRDSKYVPSREKCMDAAHEILELFDERRDNPDYNEYSWVAAGALHAFHAGTVVGLRCYLEPLSCDERDWIALKKACVEFENLIQVDGWNTLGEKATKVFGILIRKALEKKALLESSLGVNGITIGATGGQPQPQQTQSFVEGSSGAMTYDRTQGAGAFLETRGTASTGLTPLYSGPLFGVNQFDLNPLTNPRIGGTSFSPTRLQGAGMPGVVASDSSPDQSNWDFLWPKGMNLV